MRYPIGYAVRQTGFIHWQTLRPIKQTGNGDTSHDNDRITQQRIDVLCIGVIS